MDNKGRQKADFTVVQYITTLGLVKQEKIVCLATDEWVRLANEHLLSQFVPKAIYSFLGKNCCKK